MNDYYQQTESQELLSQWLCDHGSAVRGYLLAMVRRPDVADDLLQEVFRRAWQARGRYEETGAARAYLLKIADRLVCDMGRRNKPVVNLDSSGWEHASPEARQSTPDARIQREESKHQLEEALEELSPAQRRVLLLRYYSDMSFAEIADALDCPLNTALSHCRRGLQAVRKVLERKHDESAAK